MMHVPWTINCERQHIFWLYTYKFWPCCNRPWQPMKAPNGISNSPRWQFTLSGNLFLFLSLSLSLLYFDSRFHISTHHALHVAFTIPSTVTLTALIYHDKAAITSEILDRVHRWISACFQWFVLLSWRWVHPLQVRCQFFLKNNQID